MHYLRRDNKVFMTLSNEKAEVVFDEDFI